MTSVAAALRIVLRVLRESGKSSPMIAYRGVFQQTPMERAAHMLRLTLRRDIECVPEISANKYALNIRFILPGSVQRAKVYEADIESTFADLLASAGKTGFHLRENEWLMAIKQRAAIPGGICEFDLPSYHHWLHRDHTSRRNDLESWRLPMTSVAAALRIVLRVLRESGKSSPMIAYRGVFQQTPMERAAHMLRLTLRRDIECVPEISANKYALNIRFILPGSVQRAKVYEADIEFELTYCNL